MFVDPKPVAGVYDWGRVETEHSTGLFAFENIDLDSFVTIHHGETGAVLDTIFLTTNENADKPTQLTTMASTTKGNTVIDSTPSTTTTTTMTPNVINPTQTTINLDLYETFTIASTEQCERAPGSVGCSCVLSDDRPCVSSALVCVDLGDEARCARLRVDTSTEPVVLSMASNVVANVLILCVMMLFAVV